MVAIGVSGHRILAEIDTLRSSLDEVVRLLDEAHPGGWTVVSSLAEGADRLVAGRLSGREATRLVAVLPLPTEEYERDFGTEASLAEFRDLLAHAAEVAVVPPQVDRDAAYEAAGRAVLDRSDVLIAVWDGRDAQGRGGTGSVVTEARRRGIPLVWIHAGNRAPGTLEPTTLGADQGVVTTEGLPPRRA